MEQFTPTMILVTPEDIAILKLLNSLTAEKKMEIHDFLLENNLDISKHRVV